MTTSPPRAPTTPLLLLWLAYATGPTAWTLHLLLGYFAVSVGCPTVLGPPLTALVMHALSLAAIAACILGAVFGYRAWERTGSASAATGAPAGRSAFLALSAIGLNVLFGLAVFVGDLPNFYLSPCS